LHTNDAPSAITRMVDMGIEPYLITATLLGIVAQRLVRVVCDSCGAAIRPADEMVAEVAAGQPDIPRPQFRRGRGCEQCGGTGYRGRTGLYELMSLNDPLRSSIIARAPLRELRALAITAGMEPLRMAGWAKASAGITTLEEVLRVTPDEPSA
jgi:type II secretory ATPase GspE/PulE/Tfp pilus assembly ATPase PilB-like protein